MGFSIRQYPHNTLANLAHYHLEVVNKKTREGSSEGIGLDCVSCLIALAFTVEAYINFLGSKKVETWRERTPYFEKLRIVSGLVGYSINKDVEPFKTLALLKEFRDEIAHGKPAEFSTDVSSDVELRDQMSETWIRLSSPDFCNHAYGEVKRWKNEWREKLGIGFGETVTSAVGGLSFSDMEKWR